MMDVDLRHLGALLREAREAHGRGTGFTVRELSLLAGVTEAAITSYESGARQPSLRNLWRLATALGIDLNHLRRQTLVHLADLSGELDDEAQEEELEQPLEAAR